MPITPKELSALEGRINAKLAQHKAKLTLTIHFIGQRVNDPRNVPPLTLKELESIFDALVASHVHALLALPDQSTFNVRCGTSHINMPCGLSKVASGNGSGTHEISVLTVMRKQNFRSHDPYEFKV